MHDDGEMSYASQLLLEIEASGLATMKDLAFWSGLHENTVRDYRESRIRHFGRESRFWNGVLLGLCQKHAPAIPAVCFRIAGIFLKGTPLTVAHLAGGAHAIHTLPTLPGIIRLFIASQEDLVAAMQSSVNILEDGRVDVRDSADIAELETKIDTAIGRLWAIKYAIGKAREGAHAR